MVKLLFCLIKIIFKKKVKKFKKRKAQDFLTKCTRKDSPQRINPQLCKVLFIPGLSFVSKIQTKHWNVNKIFHVLPFFNTYIEKPEVKKLINVELLKESPFYDDLSIVKKRLHLVVMLKVIKLKLLIRRMLLFN